MKIIRKDTSCTAWKNLFDMDLSKFLLIDMFLEDGFFETVILMTKK